LPAEALSRAGPTGPAPFEAFFLDGSAGRLFCVFRPGRPLPSRAGAAAPVVLVLPAFAEEMNKTRRMLSLFAQQAQAAGIGTLIPDLYGTGDSEGDFGEATLERWADDLDRAARWLEARSAAPLSVLAVRCGALLANLLPGRRPGGSLVLWQPVTSGRVFANQFLRLRLAGELLAGGGQADSAALRKELEREGRLEVAGYETSAELLRGLESLELKQLDPAGYRSVRAFEVGTLQPPAVSPALERVLAGWRRDGGDVAGAVVAGDPFWGTTEIATVPALVTATVDAFLAGAAAR
jgi:exosortase A-associated hydrolase 2